MIIIVFKILFLTLVYQNNLKIIIWWKFILNKKKKQWGYKAIKIHSHTRVYKMKRWLKEKKENNGETEEANKKTQWLI
jgi:hypothetical protein